MKFKMIHENYNVYDLDKTMAFFEKALVLKEKTQTSGRGRLFYHCLYGK